MPRPVEHTTELAETICERLAEGRSLRSICDDDDMPSRATILRWQDADADFEAKCARARTLQADLMDDMVLDTANASTPETAAADRVKIGAYQWRAGRLAPKKYGDRTILAGDKDAPVEMTVLTDLDRAKGAAALLAKAKAAIKGGE